jgi:hypothetical protein
MDEKSIKKHYKRLSVKLYALSVLEEHFSAYLDKLATQTSLGPRQIRLRKKPRLIL